MDRPRRHPAAWLERRVRSSALMVVLFVLLTLAFLIVRLILAFMPLRMR
jgi:hypothetical protein